MDRDMLKQHLRDAEERLARGLQHIARQKEIISGLDLEGPDLAAAQELLATLEEMQKVHTADRDEIERKLSIHTLAGNRGARNAS
jgi:hypothetical protein